MLKIKNSCKENWNEFTPTQKGAFCSKCNTNVIDFSKLSNQQLISYLNNRAGSKFCGKFKTSQIEELNLNFHAWHKNTKQSLQSKFIFSLLVIFGFTLFSFTNNNEIKSIKHLKTIFIDSLNTNDSIKQNNKLECETYELKKDLLKINTNLNTYKQIKVKNKYLSELNTHILGFTVLPDDFHINDIEENTPPLIKINTLQTQPILNKSIHNTYTLNITSKYKEDYMIYIYNFDGKIVYRKKEKLQKGHNSVSINLNEYPQDKYSLTIVSKSQFKTLDFDNC